MNNRLNSSVFYMANPDDVKDVQAAEVRKLTSYPDKNKFSEDWLQDVIFRNPLLLPVQEIEPGFERIFPVCRELSLPSGFLDNLYVTDKGNLVLVECKLWRNPESRRKVLSQIMDYAKDFSEISYDELSKKINAANKTNDENPLFQIAQNIKEDIDETQFVDSVSRNMRLGRNLLLIVGDGIQEGLEKLAGFIQNNMALHFTMGLVEIGLYKLPSSSAMVIVSKVIAKTTIIERGILRIESGNAQIVLPEQNTASSVKPRAQSLTEEEFFENLGSNSQKYVDWLKYILEKSSDLGVTWDMERSLILRYEHDEEISVGIGYFRQDGRYITSNCTWALSKFGLDDVGMKFIADLLKILPGSDVRFNRNGGDPKVMVNGQKLHIRNLMGKEADFLEILGRHVQRLKTALDRELK